LILFSKNRYVKNTHKFQNQVAVFLSNRSLIKNLPLSFSAWIIQGIILSLIINVFITELSYIVIIGIYCISILIGALSLEELALQKLLFLFFYNVGLTPEQAVARAIVSRIVTLWLAIILGIASLLIYSFQLKKFSQN
jgi:glycosyltransferase 2 family protein